MTIISSLILGVVEGISEFLPISSTAHLIITSRLMGLVENHTLSSFLIVIQLGAIASVLVLYTKTLLKSPKLILKIAAGFIPTAIIGLAAYKLVKDYLLESLPTIAWALLLGGIALILLEKHFAKKKIEEHIEEKSLSDISYKQAALVGVFQSLAVIPGVSRSAATIMGGLSLGISRKNIVEFSFLLALPTMLAASALDLYKSPPHLSHHDIILWAIGLVTAFITATLGIRYFLRFIKKHDFKPFGWYRIVLGIIILIWLFV